MEAPITGLIVIIGVFTFFVAALRWVYRLYPVSVEVERKVMHLVTGGCLISLPWFFHTIWAATSLISIIILGPFLVTLIPWTNKIFGRTLAVKRKNIGGPIFGVAFLILFFLAKDYRLYYLISALVVVFSDAAAAMIGIRYPFIPYEVLGYKKTISGSIAFFIVALFCVLIPLLLYSPYPAGWIWPIGLLITAVATGVEAFSPYGLDNFFIPLVVYFLLVFLL